MIQFSFEDGIESPIFDSNAPDQSVIKVNQVRQSEIVQLESRSAGSYVYQLHFIYKDGSKDDVTDSYAA